MSNQLSLCLNCLEPGAIAIDVGPDQGSQRDPYRQKAWLCPTCGAALLEGDFSTLAERWRAERPVRRPEPPE